MAHREGYLIVCGSRALARLGEAAHEWVDEILLDEIGRNVPHAVVTGDARGPDEWAAECANGFPGIEIVRFCTNGDVTAQNQGPPEVIGNWSDIRGVDLAAAPPEKRPLHRNAAMVALTAKRAVRREASVHMIAFVLPDPARPHDGGTMHTVKAAFNTNITCDVRVWGLSHYFTRVTFAGGA